jgi:hypothetical protein
VSFTGLDFEVIEITNNPRELTIKLGQGRKNFSTAPTLELSFGVCNILKIYI